MAFSLTFKESRQQLQRLPDVPLHRHRRNEVVSSVENAESRTGNGRRRIKENDIVVGDIEERILAVSTSFDERPSLMSAIVVAALLFDLQSIELKEPQICGNKVRTEVSVRKLKHIRKSYGVRLTLEK